MIRFVLLGGVGRVPHLSKPQIGCADVNDPVGRARVCRPLSSGFVHPAQSGAMR